LVERKAIDYVTATEARQTALGTAQDAFAGSIAGAYGGNNAVPTYMGLRVIVSDDLAPTSTDYPVYFFTQGAIASGEQMGLRTETDRDILAKSQTPWRLTCTMSIIRLALSGALVQPTQHKLSLPLLVTGRKCTKPRTLVSVRATVTSNF
jgi:hypothetical protein